MHVEYMRNPDNCFYRNILFTKIANLVFLIQYHYIYKLTITILRVTEMVGRVFGIFYPYL